MDSALLRQFQDTIAEQCTYALEAYQRVQTEQTIDTIEVFWSSVQSFVVATANISKLLWGQGGSHAAEREPLRVSLGVVDSSPLRPTKMRNHFEHIDERLVHWWNTSSTRAIVDLNIGPYPFWSGLGEVDVFRTFDPETGQLWFWGDSFNLPSVVAEIGRVAAAASR